ncbi:MAG TPA: hydantoinase/oxoprolinase family protein, partial [Chloroflexota bacterium]|nr:hydantoinase/oxoprolinase family protein [Chloroflexota bacterium]
MYVIGTDIGGTFTDCAIVDEKGAIATFSKSPSTPDDPARGVMNVLEVTARDLGLSRRQLLEQTELFIHGTTIATNAMIERKGVLTGLIITKGHEDTIEIGRVAHKVAGLSETEIIHESKLHKPDPPVIARRNVMGVAERLDPQGQIVVPLNEQQVISAAEELVQHGIQAIAVCLLYSYLDSTHEKRVADLIHERFPDIFLATSHEIAPVLGEYERAVTTVLTCYLGPKVAAYVERLEEALKAEGFGRQLLMMHAGGGVTTPVETKKKPLLLMDSGPVGGSLGSRFFGGVYGEPNVICTDMGGTSFDVSIIIDGHFHKADEAIIDQYRVLQPKVEITTIGSGGGSIVWLDQDGVLHVGPESAGAVPGPACYDTGGTRPTVTDADLVLGYLNPDYFLGGRVKLNAAKAREAFQPIAQAMNVSVEEVALGAARVVNAQMADAIRRDTIEKGLDPRQFAVFSYGGAGPVHAAFFGRDLHVKSVYIPQQATVFSALGMVTADVVNAAERSASVWLPL